MALPGVKLLLGYATWEKTGRFLGHSHFLDTPRFAHSSLGWHGQSASPGVGLFRPRKRQPQAKPSPLQQKGTRAMAKPCRKNRPAVPLPMSSLL